MILILLLQIVPPAVEGICGDIVCSNVIDHVCGMARAVDGTTLISKYQNVCHMRKIRCRLKSIVEIAQVPDEICNIKRGGSYSGRRVSDFSVVGAHQACNHTCPTYCVDTYEPACAQIWKRGMSRYSYRPMVNHCHIDLFSCAVGVNVTILPIGKCYKNPSGLMFMTQVAAMKSLKLLDDTPVDFSFHTKYSASSFTRRLNQIKSNIRRSNDDMDWQIQNILKQLIN